MPTLYVTEQGARIEKEHQRLLVAKEDQVLLATPMARVDHLVLVGNVGVTTPALLALLDADVGLSFVNRAGKLRGRLAPATHKNLELRHRQRDRTRDAGYCLAISRAIVGGKLRNCRTLARRLARTRPTIGEEPFQRMTDALAALPSAADLGVVRGLEGSGSRAYFAVLRQSLAADLGFDRRTRRPPRDPVNALLSLGYTLLTENLMAACEVVGLDPYDGFLHIAYDIPNDRRRTKLHDALLSFGSPVQYSVFECLVDDRELARLRSTVRRLIKPRLDHVRYYHLCAACQARIETTRAGVEVAHEEDVLIV